MEALDMTAAQQGVPHSEDCPLDTIALRCRAADLWSRAGHLLMIGLLGKEAGLWDRTGPLPMENP